MEGGNIHGLFGSTIHPDIDHGTTDPMEYPLASDQFIYIPLFGVPVGWNLHGTPKKWMRVNHQ